MSRVTRLSIVRSNYPSSLLARFRGFRETNCSLQEAATRDARQIRIEFNPHLPPRPRPSSLPDWVVDKMAEAPASPLGGGSHESGGEQSPQSGGVREQDRYLPIANISRIMKKALPNNGKIAKDAKDTVQECVSEFISFITSEASDKCQKEKRKTINGDDLLWAMATLGFEDYIEPLKVYLARLWSSYYSDVGAVDTIIFCLFYGEMDSFSILR
ncbi:hypothetical protein NL676_037240 [Syzygium grande]|nr:hypothetical protein NL676_037240 [Syzygium grande]